MYSVEAITQDSGDAHFKLFLVIIMHTFSIIICTSYFMFVMFQQSIKSFLT